MPRWHMRQQDGGCSCSVPLQKGPTLSGNSKPLGIPLEGIRPPGTIVPLGFQPSGKESAVGRLLASGTHENYVNTVILFK